ncbi:glycosyltransferase family 2 protein [Dysgonomonas sp.]
MTLISIIVPCYNQAQYLSECLQSVSDQTYTNWECIIINDGSTDNTDSIASQWTAKDSRIKYIKKHNEGVCVARNTGISIANGEWILPLDGDDKIGNDYLRQAKEIMDSRPDVGLIYAQAELFGDECEIWNLPEYNFKSLLRANMIYCSAFYKKEDWIKTGGYDVSMKHGWEDWEFWINLLGTTNKNVFRLDYLGFYYRIKKNSRNYTLARNDEQVKEKIQYITTKHLNLYLNHIGTFHHLCDVIDDQNYNNFLLQEKVKRYETNLIIKFLKKIYNIFN